MANGPFRKHARLHIAGAGDKTLCGMLKRLTNCAPDADQANCGECRREHKATAAELEVRAHG